MAETRAACANEVRKRDRQIEGLRKAAAEAGRARGERKSAGLTTIQITGEFGGEDSGLAGASSTREDGYSLRQETNGILAQLAKGLSEENDTLLTLVRKTNDSLKDISGFGKEEGEGAAAAKLKVDHAKVLTASPEDLTTDLDNVVAHVRNILSNPSFAPLEEVLVREEEIFRLRDGWEKMETRWREAVHLIDGWRRRMAANGQPVNMEELKMGLRLSPIKVPNVKGMGSGHNQPFNLSTLEEEEEEQSISEQRPESPSPAGSLHLVPAPGYEDKEPVYEEARDEIDDSDQSSIFEDDVDIDMDELQDSEPNVEILQQSAGYELEESTSLPLPPPPKITLLEETNAARNRIPPVKALGKSRKRSGAILEDEANETGDEAPPPPPHATKPDQSPQKRLKLSTGAEDDKPASRPTSDLYTNSNSSLDSILLLKPSPESSTSKASSKTTTRSTRSNAPAPKKETAIATKPTMKAVKAVAQEKKDTPPKTIMRTRSTRATAATSSSAARSAPTKPDPSPATRSRPNRSNPAPTTEMAPPPRPRRTANVSTANQSTPAPTKITQPEPKKISSTDKEPLVAITDPPQTASKSHTTSQSAVDSPLRTSPTKSASRLPLPRNVLPGPQQSPVTVASIAAKLAASERDANAARVRAKLKAARLTKGGPASAAGGDPMKKDREVSGSSSVATGSLSLDENGRSGGVSIVQEAEEADTSKEEAKPEVASISSPQKRFRQRPAVEQTPRRADASPVKDTATKRKREVRSRAEKVASRRRSTLSPWELQSLIAGDVMPPTPQIAE